MPIRITGMNSGLDTEAIITELVSSYSYKKQSYEKAQTKLSWKQDAWKSLNTDIYSFYSGKLSNMRYSSAYNKKSVSASNTSKATFSASSSAVVGTQSLKITSLAKSAYLTGAKADDDITGNTRLSDLGIEPNTDSEGNKTPASSSITVTYGGKDYTIGFDSDTSVSSLMNNINKETGMNASFDAKNHRAYISAGKSGAEFEFSLKANDAASQKMLYQLGVLSLDDIATKKEDGTLELVKSISAAEKEIKNGGAAEKIAELEWDEAVKNGNTNSLNGDNEVTYNLSDADSKKQYIEYRAGVLKATDFTKGVEDAAVKDAFEGLAKLKAKEKPTGNTDGTTTDEQKYYDDYKKEFLGTIEANKEKENIIKEITDDDGKYVESNNSKFGTRIAAADAKIVLNEVEYTSNTNAFSVNGLTINVNDTTKADETISVTTSLDNDSVYDGIKSLIKEYSTLLNKMDELYNADNAKGYDPLTSDQKDEMSDDEVEQWEKKIKDSLLRRDNTLGSLTSEVAAAMSKSYDIEVNGEKKSMSLADFGINTLGYFVAAKNEKHAYHIDGDSDDEVTSVNKDKLKAAIATDPDTVSKFFSELAKGVYSAIDKKMKGTTLSSTYKVYNDKQLDKEYRNYTDLIKKWEDKVSHYEDYYYKKFSAMETALAKLQSSTSSLSMLMGG